MFKKILAVSLFMIVVSSANAFAEDVYTTVKGTKYHKESCRLLKNKESAIKLDKKQAVDQGYAPCGRCFKEDLVKLDGQVKLNK